MSTTSAVSEQPIDLFAAPARQERLDFGRRYVAFLAGRNGALDAATGMLSGREAATAATIVSPYQHRDLLDQAAYEGLLAGAGITAELTADREAGLRWAAALSELVLGSSEPAVARGEGAALVAERRYHERYACEALAAVGLSARRPAASRRAAGPAGDFASVLVDIAALQLLIDLAGEIFAKHQRPLARIREVLGEILVDRIGHALYLRTTLSPARLRQAQLTMVKAAAERMAAVPGLAVLAGHARTAAALVNVDVEMPRRIADLVRGVEWERPAAPAAQGELLIHLALAAA